MNDGPRFRRQIARPVSCSDAQRVRWVTIVPALVGIVICPWGWPHFDPYGWADAVRRWGIWECTLTLFSAGLYLAAWTGLPSWFFHPARQPVERQNRTGAS